MEFPQEKAPELVADFFETNEEVIATNKKLSNQSLNYMKFKYSQPHLFKQKQPVQIGPKTQKSNNISTPKPNETQVLYVKLVNTCFFLFHNVMFLLSDFIS